MGWLEFLSSLVWPAVIVAAGLYLKNDLRALLRRLTEFGGAKFKPQEDGPSSQERIEKVAAQLEKEGAHEFVRALVAWAHGEIPAGEEHEDKVALLLAATVAFVRFEGLNVVIYGSQLRFLAQVRADGSATVEDAEAHYGSAASASPKFYEDQTFAAWLDWLVVQGLVRREDGKLHLQPLGDLVLTVRAKAGAPDRPY